MLKIGGCSCQDVDSASYIYIYIYKYVGCNFASPSVSEHKVCKLGLTDEMVRFCEFSSLALCLGRFCLSALMCVTGASVVYAEIIGKFARKLGKGVVRCLKFFGWTCYGIAFEGGKRRRDSFLLLPQRV